MLGTVEQVAEVPSIRRMIAEIVVLHGIIWFARPGAWLNSGIGEIVIQLEVCLASRPTFTVDQKRRLVRNRKEVLNCPRHGTVLNRWLAPFYAGVDSYTSGA
jgi:hypothetical protein